MDKIILLEAESFEDSGGWIVDQQFMDQMGSPYLMAHGLGLPVKDALTTVQFPAAGIYRVWVRTKDWAASLGASGAPGRFQLAIDGRRLPAVFGAEGAQWRWQDGGTVEIAARKTLIALHDLTGFNGRCDAIVFSKDPDFRPPESGPELAKFRRSAAVLPAAPEEAGEFDLVVAGGGIAGICAALSAARRGLKVALVHDRPVLGGNNSSEVRVGLSGEINLPPYPSLGNIVKEIAPVGYYDFIAAEQNPTAPESRRILKLDPAKRIHNAGPAENYEDEKKLLAVQAEEHIRLFLNCHVTAVKMNGDEITAVTAADIRTGREQLIKPRLAADCTGDGALGALAGADFRVGRENRAETGEELAPEKTDRLVMGTSVQWYAGLRPEPVSFPECPWALPFTEETCQHALRGDWNWESGIGADQIADFEKIRDHSFRAIFGNWDFLKNRSRRKDEYARHALAWAACIGGKRESRRLQGDIVLCQQDIESRKPFPDACVTCTWPFDLHYPDPENQRHLPGQEFLAISESKPIKPYAIPYRCLYSRNIRNLFMAGRNISVTHAALGTVRVQKTTGMMGEVVGMAAALCRKHDVFPRAVYETHLSELTAMMKRG
ncbi:MAG: FAD-dependent oxidoreductase [Kiritimatiellae bacterium]|nr:FAD-dependent oxidoreductase [Kiritimatiellia bacterium]